MLQPCPHYARYSFHPLHDLLKGITASCLTVILLLISGPSSACSCGSWGIEGFIGQPGVVPSNYKGLLWSGGSPDLDAFVVRDSSEELLKVNVEKFQPAPLPAEGGDTQRRGYPPRDYNDLWLVRPENGFQVGERYQFSYHNKDRRIADDRESLEIEVTELELLNPPAAMPLKVSNPWHDSVSISAGVSCSEVSTAHGVEIRMELPKELEVFRDQFFYETIIDDSYVWRPTTSMCDVLTPGESQQGKGKDSVYRVCGPGWEERNLDKGPHTVRMRALLPGTDFMIESRPFDLELNCFPESADPREVALKNENPAARHDAVAKLTDQTLLKKIALTDEDYSVRGMAKRRISDQSILEDIGYWTEPKLTRKLGDKALLTDIAKTSPDYSVRGAALDALDDPAIFKQIYLDDRKGSRAGYQALERIEDQHFLVRALLDADFMDTGNEDGIWQGIGRGQIIAIEKLTTQELLIKVARRHEHYVMRSRAVEKIDKQEVLQEIALTMDEAVLFLILNRNSPPTSSLTNSS
jgi:hypothetical protein